MLSLRTLSITLATLSIAACMDPAGQPAPEPTDSPAPSVTDTDQPLPAQRPSPISNLGAPGEIAFGAIDSNGTKLSGTSNWTSTFNASLTRYEITITGESYLFSNYATMVTPMGDVRYCLTSSVSGKLLISCTNSAGAAASSRISFVTFKP
jgi:hypothetical protein